MYCMLTIQDHVLVDGKAIVMGALTNAANETLTFPYECLQISKADNSVPYYVTTKH